MITGSDLIGVRAELHRLNGRLDEAERDARRARELLRARGWRAPLKSLAGLRLAETLIDRGEEDEARAVLAEEEAIARGPGTPGTLGMILRVRGRIDGDHAEAIALLERSSMRLELARALLSAGELDRALELATRIGAKRLARLAVEAGATPSADGVELTPDERRIAGLAAGGLGDREIAEALWVTQRAVEQQLDAALAKLGVTTRAELAGAL
jgi:ATP/maltotriose-dependent transcriptional regulator MalT